MLIKEHFRSGETVVSFETFPPKPTSPLETVYNTLKHLRGLNPAFISVTYGAGGSNQGRMLQLASALKAQYQSEVLAHLTCVCADALHIDEVLDSLSQMGIQNVLALRGDIPQGQTKATAFDAYRHASDLVRHIHNRGGFCIAAAAYPETHIESDSEQADIDHLKAKVDQGVDFLITQLCFDNEKLLRFRDRIRAAGIHIPISFGIMPVLDASQILRMTTLCGCSIPAALSKLIGRYGQQPEEFKKAGIDYAIAQVSKLYQDRVDGIHLYSMNKHAAIETILNACHIR